MMNKDRLKVEPIGWEIKEKIRKPQYLNEDMTYHREAVGQIRLRRLFVCITEQIAYKVSKTTLIFSDR